MPWLNENTEETRWCIIRATANIQCNNEGLKLAFYPRVTYFVVVGSEVVESLPKIARCSRVMACICSLVLHMNANKVGLKKTSFIEIAYVDFNWLKGGRLCHVKVKVILV